MTGGLAGLVQLVVLQVLVNHHWQPLPANAVAFLLAAQLNFGLSSLFTWRDRGLVERWRVRGLAGSAPLLAQRWLTFHGAIASMAVVNMLTFAVAHHFVPVLAASALGICTAAIGNFLLGDRLVFRSRGRARSSVLRAPIKDESDDPAA